MIIHCKTILCGMHAGYDHKALEKPLLQYYPLVSGDTSTLLSIEDYSETWMSYSGYHISTVLPNSRATLSVNGNMLVSDGSGGKFNISQTIIGYNTLLKEIFFQYNASDEGFYIYLPYIGYYYIQHLHSDSYHYYGYHCYDYSDYVSGYLNLYYLSFTTLPFVLKTYSKYIYIRHD